MFMKYVWKTASSELISGVRGTSQEVIHNVQTF